MLTLTLTLSEGRLAADLAAALAQQEQIELLRKEITITTPEYNLTATTSITLGVGGNTIVINGSGVSINGRQFLAHEHSGVMTGGGITGGVV